LYLNYWGLIQKPFENTLDSSFFYASKMHTGALQRVLYALTEQKGCVLLSGEYGCGKTALVRMVVESLTSGDYADGDIALINFPLFTGDELMRKVLFQFGIEGVNGSRLDMFHRVGAMLFERLLEGRKNLLVIDEAQLISEPDVQIQGKWSRCLPETERHRSPSLSERWSSPHTGQ